MTLKLVRGITGHCLTESVEERTKPVLAEYLSHVISRRCQTSIQTLRKKGKGMLAIQ